MLGIVHPKSWPGYRDGERLGFVGVDIGHLVFLLASPNFYILDLCEGKFIAVLFFSFIIH